MSVELVVAFEIEIPLHSADRKQVPDLRTNAGDTRLEVSQNRQLTAVRCDLLIGMAHKADEQLLRQELRSRTIEMEVDTASVLRIGILEIVSEAANRRKFVAGLRVEVGVVSAVTRTFRMPPG